MAKQNRNVLLKTFALKLVSSVLLLHIDCIEQRKIHPSFLVSPLLSDGFYFTRMIKQIKHFYENKENQYVLLEKDTQDFLRGQNKWFRRFEGVIFKILKGS